MRTMGKLICYVLVGVFCSQLLHCAGKRTAKDWSKVCLWSDVKMLLRSGVILFFAPAGLSALLDLLGYLCDDAEKDVSFFLVSVLAQNLYVKLGPRGGSRPTQLSKLRAAHLRRSCPEKQFSLSQQQQDRKPPIQKTNTNIVSVSKCGMYMIAAHSSGAQRTTLIRTAVYLPVLG